MARAENVLMTSLHYYHVLLLLLLTSSLVAESADIRNACISFCSSPEYANQEVECVAMCEEVIARRLARYHQLGKGEMLDVESDLNAIATKRKSSFVRIGRGGKSSFVRIGRGHPGISNDMSSFLRDARGGKSSFVRIGRGHYLDEDMDSAKRGSSFVRIGKSSQPEISDDALWSEFPDTLNEAEKRRSSSFVRIGRAAQKRKSSFVRIGKAFPKRKSQSSFVRIGKKSDETPDEDMYLRPKEEVSSEQKSENVEPVEKSNAYEGPMHDYIPQYQHYPSYKRASSFVRIGKGYNYKSPKRVSSFVRIGKSMLDNSELKPEGEKRKSSFVRIGKSDEMSPDTANLNNDVETKRASSFVRIGKNVGTWGNGVKQQHNDNRLRNDDEEEMNKKGQDYVRIG